MIRTDLSSKLIHLTRTVGDLSAEKRFARILSEKTLLGSANDVRGNFNVVAFTEAPISILASILANAKILDMRYAPLGFMVDKKWLYERGGRPVIYETHQEYEDLPDSKKYLHVRYEPHRNADYSWEREWRIKTDHLKLDPAITTVIVPNRDWVNKYHEVHTSNLRSLAFLPRVGGHFIYPPEWHFIALDDLGIPFEGMEPISFKQFELSVSINPTK